MKGYDFLDGEKRRELIDEIILFFKNERDEEIGVIAAETILDFFIEKLSKDSYLKGVEDSKNLLKKTMEDLEINLDTLL
ncbi:DUF2164 domain-containing protein [Candidatus Woesearchaeota archaeon]|nr:MAG: DUF2164 domain-containing protein [Candidatus Woesearchaeota archaeon]